LLNKANEIKKKMAEHGLQVKIGHINGEQKLPIGIIAGQANIAPIELYMSGNKVRVEMKEKATAAMTLASPEHQQIIRSEVVGLNEFQEGPEFEDQNVAQARSNVTGRLQKIMRKMDRFVASLGPVEISALKKLLVKKYRKIKGKDQ
jgi:hypothetical protein